MPHQNISNSSPIEDVREEKKIVHRTGLVEDVSRHCYLVYLMVTAPRSEHTEAFQTPTNT